jgi:hypothetical protein
MTKRRLFLKNASFLALVYALMTGPSGTAQGQNATDNIPEQAKSSFDTTPHKLPEKPEPAIGWTLTKGDQILRVAQEDLSVRMSWEEARDSCLALGNGWRLPTKEELELMYNQLYLKGQGNFHELGYWSADIHKTGSAWAMYFLTGYAYPTRTINPIRVRPVR